VIDRSIGIIGIALALLTGVVSHYFPNQPTWTAPLGYGAGIFLVGFSIGLLSAGGLRHKRVVRPRAILRGSVGHEGQTLPFALSKPIKERMPTFPRKRIKGFAPTHGVSGGVSLLPGNSLRRNSDISLAAGRWNGQIPKPGRSHA
jgi:hypothetical protein